MKNLGRILRVLVVDDDQDDANNLARLLKTWHHEAQTVCESSAVDMLSIFKPDVVLLAVGRPSSDGHPVARQVRAKPVAKPPEIIALSEPHGEASQLFSRDRGFDHFLIKPIDAGVLEKLLLLKLMDVRLAEGE